MTSFDPPPLPGRVHSVHADSVLVVAPHDDDEVLGCGGLVSRLAEGGSAVRVLVLTDGAAHSDDPEAYAARRRAEAAAVAERLGFVGTERLGLPDGELVRHVDAVADALGRALLTQRPTLLLVPSPHEVSADHRAAFAAVHRLLTSVRAPDSGRSADGQASSARFELYEVARDLRILAYEINRPLEPDLLVDIGDRLDVLREAMELYASQQERHDYLRAAIGLRRYRTLTLAPDVEAAEAYRTLRLDDFTTQGLSRLVEQMGAPQRRLAAAHGPTISVVVRTKDRPALLAEALASIAASTWRNLEVILVNDGGAPPDVPEGYPLPLVRVELEETRGRSAAANAGVAAATGAYLAFLDDDDLVEPEHYETLAGLVAAAGVRVAYSDAAVGVYALEGATGTATGTRAAGATTAAGGWVEVERRVPYSRDFDAERLLIDNYIPFNTLLIDRALFAELSADSSNDSPFDESLPFFEDWDFLVRLATLAPFHHLARVTCEYRQFRGSGHHVLGDRPRHDEFLHGKARVLAKHRERLDAETLSRVVDRLRADVVAAGEAEAAARKIADDARDAAHRALGRAESEETHRRIIEVTAERLGAELRNEAAQRGEAQAALERVGFELHGARAQLDDTREQLDDARRELGEVRDQAASQSTELQRAYEEIGRLTALVESMESTRAWRLHQTVEKLKPRGGDGT